MVERKALCANPRHQYHVSNEQNMIVVPITKRMEIIMSVQVCLISGMKSDYNKNGGKKAFPANPNHQYHVSNVENMIVVPTTKIMEIIIVVQVCLISE